MKKLFVDLAIADSNRVFDINKQPSTYPYNLNALKRTSRNEIRESFGEATENVKGQNGKSYLLKYPLDTNLIRAVVFIEDWELDTVAMKFTKTIQGIVPVRIIKDPNHISPRLRKTCLLINEPGNAAPGVLLARVKCEVLLFDPVFAKSMNSDRGAYNNDELLNNHEIAYSPLFSSYSRNVLNRFVQNSATSGKMKCYDFFSNMPVTDKKEIRRLLGYIEKEVNVFDAVKGTQATMIVEEQMGTIKSLVFCEEWYYHPAGKCFSKKVVGIAPVVWDNETGIPKPCFTLWFDEERMF